MKKFIFISALMILSISCRSNNDPKLMIAGGFEKADVKSEKIRVIAAYAETELQKEYPGLKITEIDKAETQIVAGTNYRLECVYIYNSGKARLRVIVYEKLTGERKITSLEMKI